MTETPPVKTRKLIELVKWVAPLPLALIVVCSGTFFCLFAGLASQGELTATVFGSDLRLWSVGDRRQTGLALQRTYAYEQAAQACTHTDVTFLYWRPSLAIETTTQDNCSD